MPHYSPEMAEKVKSLPGMGYALPTMRSRGNQKTRRLRSIQHELLTYLTSHPEAKDTLKGIQQWWFADALTRVRLGDLTSALAELVHRGWITATNPSGAETLYGLSKEHLKEIEEFVIS